MVGKRGVYIVKNHDTDIAPEETLMDNISGHETVEVPIGQGVFRAVYGMVFLALAILLVQAVRLQAVQGSHFADTIEESRYHRYPVPSVRGKIFDRNGAVLADNIPAYDLVGFDTEKGVYLIKRDVPANIVTGPNQYLAEYFRRSYPLSVAAAHVLGYTSQMTADELRDYPDARSGERVGRLGIEASYDSVLRGEPWNVVLDGPQKSPTPGQDITLTLDSDVQKHLYRALDQVFRINGVKRGAAVVQNFQTGEVLGMVSLPAFDPENITEKNLQDKNHPLFNRVIGGLYAPGSTIKPLLAMAGLKENVVDENTKIFAEGAIQVQSEVDPSVYYTFRDWKVHGWTDIYKAIADSVDIYFYELGGKLGIERIQKYLKIFLVDQKTGIDLPGEASGFIPSRKPWYIGDTYNTSIGQGDLAVTPIWLNMYVGAIANGGKLMKPSLIGGNAEILATLPFDSKTMQIVSEGMRQTVTDGTAQLLKDLPVQVFAKTGTAQVTGRGLNSLFVVYGDDIAMTVLVEQIPQSQALAMQVAKEFLSWYFSKQ